MSYAVELAKIARRKIALVEIDMMVCDLVWNTAPCSPAGGASECYNTFKTCNDDGMFTDPKANFDPVTKTYQFTSYDMPALDGYRPYLKSYNLLSQEIKDNITVKNRIYVELADDNGESDVSEDPYWSTRGHSSVNVNGSYFKRLFARNPAFKYRNIRIYEGMLQPTVNALDGSWQLRFSGKIENISFVKGSWRIECIDNLRFLGGQKLTAKIKSALAVDITQSQTTGISVTTTSGMASSGVILIDNELIHYVSLSSTTLVTVTRGYYGSIKSNHQQGAKITRVYHYEGNPFYIMRQMLIDYSIGYDTVPFTELIGNAIYSGEPNLSCLITSDTKVVDLFYELAEQFGAKVWLNSEGYVTIRRNIFYATWALLPSYLSTQVTLTDDEHIVENSTSIDWNEESRFSRIEYIYDLKFYDAKRALSAAINSSTLTIPVTSVEDLPTQGEIIIGTERIEYISVNTTTVVINAITRGARGTTAASHSSGDAVYQGDVSSLAAPDESASYTNSLSVVDTDAETQHGRSDLKRYYCRWFNSFAQYSPLSYTISGYAAYLATLAAKMLASMRDARIRFAFELEIKDEDLNIGDFHLLTTDDFNNPDTTDFTAEQFQVIKKDLPSGNKIKYISERVISYD